ncbi:MAG TPA: cytochrome c [Acidocella sp.]|jgi:mono/diheme cytochrome c family protein|uniref:cytochrome c n=1 Tax=Acidocella sp. TaxID=50710 RepID=UPI002C2A7F90|nr:cytochrome c [Acidocella sp.]HVE21689.1 cytochrome c [Acidocella sp.]
MASKITPLRVVAGLVILGVVGLGVAVGAPVAFGGDSGNPSASLPVPITPALIQRGSYVAVEGDCAACHTNPGGQAFAGGLPINTPIGAVFTSNITPDKQTGIGSWSYGEFERAVRRGVRPDGTAMYPAMPFPSYAHIDDADMEALYAYFSKGVQPVVQQDKPANIPWPLSMRWPLTWWRWFFAPVVQPASAPGSAQDAELARGAYLVEGLEHCGTCHTDRGIGLQELALTPQGGPAYLAGAVVDNYSASDLRGDPLTGLGRWSEQDIVEFLQTGHNSKTAAFGGMTDVVTHSTSHMQLSDLQAIAHFIKSLPGSGQEQAFVYNPAVALELQRGDVSARGAQDYLNNCASCHLSSGAGYTDTFPALAGNPVVNAANPVSLIHIVLTGGSTPPTAGAPTSFTMPGFADRLSDQEVADIVTFIRSSWGNQGAPIDASTVAGVRKAINAPEPTLSK